MFLDLSFSTVPYACEVVSFFLPLRSDFLLALWWFLERKFGVGI